MFKDKFSSSKIANIFFIFLFQLFSLFSSFTVTVRSTPLSVYCHKILYVITIRDASSILKYFLFLHMKKNIQLQSHLHFLVTIYAVFFKEFVLLCLWSRLVASHFLWIFNYFFYWDRSLLMFEIFFIEFRNKFLIDLIKS